MIILLVLFMITAIILFIIKARSPSAYWMAWVLLGWFLSMFGLVMFISKYGGFYYKVNLILFLNDFIRNLLLESPISIDAISRMITFGRSLFIFSLTGLSLSLFYNKPFKQMWKSYTLNTIFPLCNAIFYDPIIYRWSIGIFDRNQTYVISIITRSWVVLSTIAAVTLMILRYRKSTISWIKTQFRLIIFGVLGLILFYFYLVFMGPMQVTDVRTYYFLYSDFSNFNPPLTVAEWYLGIFMTTITTIICVISIWRYTDVEKQLGRSNLRLERKLKTANMGVRVFTHGIKNQLIMTQVLLNQTTNILNNNVDTDEKALSNINKASDIVNQTLLRLDQLYSSFKTNHLELKPIWVNELIEKTISKLKVVPENTDFQCSLLQKDTTILGDQFHLSEAIYNLLTNAFEAIGDNDGGKVSIEAVIDFTWLLINVNDNGSGIPYNQIDNIFDPFFTSKNTTRNWGVGLSYTKQVVNGHFGHIQVNSEVNRGSSFSIFIPTYALSHE